MTTGIRNRWGNITGAGVLLLLLAGAIIAPYAFAVSEPVKVILFGAALVGLAVWGKRYLKRQTNL